MFFASAYTSKLGNNVYQVQPVGMGIELGIPFFSQSIKLLERGACENVLYHPVPKYKYLFHIKTK